MGGILKLSQTANTRFTQVFVAFATVDRTRAKELARPGEGWKGGPCAMQMKTKESITSLTQGWGLQTRLREGQSGSETAIKGARGGRGKGERGRATRSPQPQLTDRLVKHNSFICFFSISISSLQPCPPLLRSA